MEVTVLLDRVSVQADEKVLEMDNADGKVLEIENDCTTYECISCHYECI